MIISLAGQARLGKGRRRLAGLHVLLQVMQQYAPECVALAVIAMCTGPAGVGAHEQDAALICGRQLKEHSGANRVAGARSAEPTDPLRRTYLRHLPIEARLAAAFDMQDPPRLSLAADMRRVPSF